MTKPKDRYQASQQGAWLSIVAYIALTALKLGVGSWAGSTALTADGLNNLTDVIGSVAVLLGLRIAGRPADQDHRYGHQRAETVAAIVVASIMGLVGLNVAIAAANSVLRPDLGAPHSASIWVGLGSALVMVGVYRYNIRLSRSTGSTALAAAAYDNRSDALTSLGAVAGIVGSQLGWRWMDPVAGLAVALVILRTAWQIGIEAAHTLTDGFDAEALQRIRAQVAQVDGVLQVRQLRARHLGNTVAVEATVAVSPHLGVTEAHVISDRVEHMLLADPTIGHVHVHVEPLSRRG